MQMPLQYFWILEFMGEKEIKAMELQRETWQRELDTKYIGDNIPGGQMKLATENKIKCQQWGFFFFLNGSLL